MSVSTAFKQGFMDAMKKMAEDAGIGSYEDNGVGGKEPHPGSYIAALRKNTSKSMLEKGNWKKPGVFPTSYVGEDGTDVVESKKDPVSTEGIDWARDAQARDYAKFFFPEGTAGFEKIYKNLINAGKSNLKHWLNDNKLPERFVPQTGFFETLPIEDEKDLNLLTDMQNSMVDSRQVPYSTHSV